MGWNSLCGATVDATAGGKDWGQVTDSKRQQTSPVHTQGVNPVSVWGGRPPAASVVIQLGDTQLPARSLHPGTPKCGP